MQLNEIKKLFPTKGKSLYNLNATNIMIILEEKKDLNTIKSLKELKSNEIIFQGISAFTEEAIIIKKETLKEWNIYRSIADIDYQDGEENLVLQLQNKILYTELIRLKSTVFQALRVEHPIHLLPFR